MSKSKIIRFAVSHAANKKVTQVASSLTFTTVLAIVPLLAVVLSLFTAFPLFNDFRVALEEFLTSSLMPPAVSENVMDYLNQFASKASRLTAFGSLALIITSIMLLRTIDQAFNNIWEVERQRPMRNRILVYWAIISLGPILTGASLWTSSVLAKHSIYYVQALPFGLNLLLTLAPLVATTLGFAALFMFVPNCKVRWRDALIGGFVTALALSIMRNGFAMYLAKFPSYTVIYGAFATLPIFLLWIYLSWITVLTGATIAATMPAIRQKQWEQNRKPGYLFINCIHILKNLWQNEKVGLTKPELGQLTQLNQTELMHALERLRELEYIVPTEISDEEIWVLACDRRIAQLKPLIHALLLDNHQLDTLEQEKLHQAISQVLAGDVILLEKLFETDSNQNQP